MDLDVLIGGLGRVQLVRTVFNRWTLFDALSRHRNRVLPCATGVKLGLKQLLRQSWRRARRLIVLALMN